MDKETLKIVSHQEQMTVQPEQPEVQPEITDGMTDNLPPLQPLTMENPNNQTIGTVNAECSNFYTKEEFYEQFKSIFQFAGDTLNVQSLPIKQNEEAGAKVTSNRIYEMAEKYAFLRFMIDRRSTRLGETILMVQFLTSKAGAVYMEKRNKKLGVEVWKKAKRIFRLGSKAKDTASLAQAAAEKQQGQDSLSGVAAG